MIAAQQGRHVFLLTDDTDPATAQARVFDRARQVIWPDFRMQSILARGYWEAPTVDDPDAVIAEAAVAARAIDP
jgi:hypothetical protein